MDPSSSRQIDPSEALVRTLSAALRPTPLDLAAPYVLLAVSGFLVVLVEKEVVLAFAAILAGLAIGMILRRPSL